MSRRLANKARAVMRKRNRTGYRPVFAEVAGAPPSEDPWAGIPAECRKTVTKTLPNGAILKTYVDVIGEAPRPPRRALNEPLEAPAEASEAPTPAPAVAPVTGPLNDPSRWSRLEDADSKEEARP